MQRQHATVGLGQRQQNACQAEIVTFCYSVQCSFATCVEDIDVGNLC